MSWGALFAPVFFWVAWYLGFYMGGGPPGRERAMAVVLEEVLALGVRLVNLGGTAIFEDHVNRAVDVETMINRGKLNPATLPDALVLFSDVVRTFGAASEVGLRAAEVMTAIESYQQTAAAVARKQ